MPRTPFFLRKGRKSKVADKLWYLRRRHFKKRTELMRVVKRLSQFPIHMQKLLLSFMYGKHRAELSRVLAATRLRARLRKSTHVRR
jgi:hypothetical protein